MTISYSEFLSSVSGQRLSSLFEAHSVGARLASQSRARTKDIPDREIGCPDREQE